MKNLTVLTAAFAAGLMTFAANAQEEGSKQVATVSAGVVGAWTRDMRIGKEEQVDKGKVALAKPHERYKAIVERYASLNGIAIELAHAVITVESNYRVYSRGKAGEVGLMQIKPATAKLMGYDGTTTGLFDPETNIKFGMKYLGKAQKLGDGTTCGTILKYNAGHGAKRMNPVSRNYCKKVKRHLAGLGADV